MSPKAFVDARRQANENNDSDNNSNTIRFEIDGQPYLPLLVATDEASMKEIIIQIFNLNSASASEAAASLLQVSPVVGGNTNQLYRISGLPSTTCTTNQQVLLRVFGGEGIIDRDVETSTYAALARQGIALPYYGRFGNGRLEEWCDTMKVLDDDEMAEPVVCMEIAKQLAKVHSQFCNIPKHLKEYHDTSKPCTVWTQLTEWLDSAMKRPTIVVSKNDETNNNGYKNEQDAKRVIELNVPTLQDELKWIKSTVLGGDAALSKMKVGFCHNDVLASNILCSRKSNNNNNDDNNNNNNNNNVQLQFLDFEYGGINYWSYDIANHFNEFAGGTGPDATPDYSKFPSPELQRLFCQSYLNTIHNNNNNNDNNNNNNNNNEKDKGEPANEDAQTVDGLLQEIQGFVLANHLVWGLWGINQAAAEGCEEFDYLKYSGYRLQRYYDDKKAWLEKNDNDVDLKREA